MALFAAGDVTKGREYQVVYAVLKEKLNFIVAKATEALEDLEESKQGDTGVKLAFVNSCLKIVDDNLSDAKKVLRPFQQQLLDTLKKG